MDFVKMKVLEQEELLKSVNSSELKEDSSDLHDIAVHINSVLDRHKNRSRLEVLIDDVDFLEYQYACKVMGNSDCIEYLRKLLYREGILLAKVVGGNSTYRRYTIDKEPLDTVKVLTSTIKGKVNYSVSQVLNNISCYYIVKCLDSSGEKVKGYIVYYFDNKGVPICKSKSFTFDGHRLYLLSAKRDVDYALKNGFKDEIQVLRG